MLLLLHKIRVDIQETSLRNQVNVDHETLRFQSELISFFLSQIEHFTLQLTHQSISIKIARFIRVDNTFLFAVSNFPSQLISSSSSLSQNFFVQYTRRFLVARQHIWSF